MAVVPPSAANLKSGIQLTSTLPRLKGPSPYLRCADMGRWHVKWCNASFRLPDTQPPQGGGAAALKPLDRKAYRSGPLPIVVGLAPEC